MTDRHKELSERWKAKSSNKKKWAKKIETTNVVVKSGEYIPPPSPKKERKIDVIIVSVNYNDFLLLTLKNNIKIFDNITVVTSPDDILCEKICEKLGVRCIITNLMYGEGDVFNKGKAINFGINSIEDPDYILLIDADIIVDKEIDVTKIDPNKLYTAERWICHSYEQLKNGENLEGLRKKENDKGLGFFHLFNYDNNCLDKKKPFPETSANASWSDLLFRDKFTFRETIENDIIHLGEPYKNWDGRITKRFLTDDEFDYELNTIQRRYKKDISLLPLMDDIKYNTTEITINFDNSDVNNDNQFMFHVFSNYEPSSENRRRHNIAQKTWKYFYESGNVVPCPYYSSETLPYIKDIFNWGLNFCKSDDDIILYTNSDICLTEDAYEKILENCNEWECTFSFRKDFEVVNEMKSSLEVGRSLFSDGSVNPKGADVFAVTKRWWLQWRDYLPDGQTIGRPTWDWVMRITMGFSLEGKITFRKKFEEQGIVCETPNISYHESHDSFWNKPQNLFNKDNISNTKIAYNWMKEKSDNIKFTGREYFESTYGDIIKN